MKFRVTFILSEPFSWQSDAQEVGWFVWKIHQKHRCNFLQVNLSQMKIYGSVHVTCFYWLAYFQGVQGSEIIFSAYIFN